MPTLPASTLKYFYETLKKSDKDQLIKFLMTSFRVEEPLNRACGIREDEIYPCLSDVVDRVLKNDVSILAKSKETNEIVGCMLNSVWRRGDVEKENPNNNQTKGKEDFAFGSTRKSVAMIGEILNELHDQFWTLRPDQDVVLHFEISSVCKNHQRQGIASAFMNWTEQIDLLQSVNATGIAAEATSLANQTLLAKRGYTTLTSILLASKIDPDTRKQLLVCDDGTDRVDLVFKQFVKAKL